MNSPTHDQALRQHTMILKDSRKARAVSIAEAAAVTSLLLPLLILVLFVVVEATQAYLIKNSLAEAARQAARDLSVEYGQDPAVAGSRSLQDTLVFDKIRIKNVVNDSQQFNNPVFDTSADPPTVKVTVEYKGGQYGLPSFPNPDPLQLGKNFKIDATSTYRLE